MYERSCVGDLEMKSVTVKCGSCYHMLKLKLEDKDKEKIGVEFTER